MKDSPCSRAGSGYAGLVGPLSVGTPGASAAGEVGPGTILSVPDAAASACGFAGESGAGPPAVAGGLGFGGAGFSALMPFHAGPSYAPGAGYAFFSLISKSPAALLGVAPMPTSCAHGGRRRLIRHSPLSVRSRYRDIGFPRFPF